MKHSFLVHTYYEDTDASGIIYHANYLKFAERARTEFLYQTGMTHNQLFDNDVMIVVARIEIDYKKPAFFEDELLVCTDIESLGAASMVLSQIITKQDTIICTLKVHLAFISKSSMRPVRIDAKLREKLLNYQNKGE